MDGDVMTLPWPDKTKLTPGQTALGLVVVFAASLVLFLLFGGDLRGIFQQAGSGHQGASKVIVMGGIVVVALLIAVVQSFRRK
jgi:hypothetical protein